jgi:CHASE2 domain-containing sensor protein
MKSGFWKTDWFFGIAVALVLLLGSNGGLLRSLERKAYDMGVMSPSRAQMDRIAVIAIDEVSIVNRGCGPWSREIQAKMTDLLAGANAKVAASGLCSTELQADSIRRGG